MERAQYQMTILLLFIIIYKSKVWNNSLCKIKLNLEITIDLLLIYF